MGKSYFRDELNFYDILSFNELRKIYYRIQDIKHILEKLEKEKCYPPSKYAIERFWKGQIELLEEIAGMNEKDLYNFLIISGNRIE